MRGDFIHTHYNHLMLPNEHSCKNDGKVQQGSWTAGSNHPGGVNMLLLDGSVSFNKSSITLSVWRGLGTRNGND